MKQKYSGAICAFIVSMLITLDQPRIIADTTNIVKYSSYDEDQLRAVRPNQLTNQGPAQPINIIPEFDYLLVNGNARISGDLSVCGAIKPIDDCINILFSIIDTIQTCSGCSDVGLASRVEQLESCCDENRSAIIDLVSIIEDLTTIIVDIESCCEQNGQGISSLEECCTILNSKVDHLQDTSNTILETTNSILDLLGGLEVLKLSNLDLIIDKLVIIDSFADTILVVISQIDALSQDILNNLSTIDNMFNSLGSQIELLAECCGQANSKIDNIQFTDNIILSVVEEVESCCSSSNSKLDTLASITESVDTRIKSLESKIDIIIQFLDTSVCS
jgi:hypothetical protein